MLNKYTLVILPLIAILSMSGCDKDSDDGDRGTGSNPGVNTAFEGTWKDQSGTTVIAGHTIDFLAVITGNDLKYDYNTNFTFTEEGTKIVQPNNKTVTKVKQTSINTCSYKITPMSIAAADNYNALNACNVHWDTGTTFEAAYCILPGDTVSLCAGVEDDITWRH